MFQRIDEPGCCAPGRLALRRSTVPRWPPAVNACSWRLAAVDRRFIFTPFTMKNRFALLPSAVLFIALVISRPVVADDANELTVDETAQGWRLLFDGKSLQGWHLYPKKGQPEKGWAVENGSIKKIGKERGGDIVTDRAFGDFDFRWQWRLTAGGNNGVKYLVTEERTSAPGHEYQMIDDMGHPDGKLGAKRQTASFYDVLPPAADKPLKPVGEWNSSRVLVRGNHVEHWLNGKKVLEYELGSEAVKTAVAASKFKNAAGFGTKISGHIMLTDHQDECWFRNLKIRELPAK